MERKHRKELTPRARELRKEMTAEERHLWYDFLKDYPVRIRRQKVIDCYIADFYCHDAGLIIEIDGSQHYSETGIEYDENRTSVIESRNLKVIRFPNSDVNKNFSGVCEAIDIEIKKRIQERHK